MFASQFYVDPLSFIGFGEFSYELGSKYSHLSSQHDFGGMTLPRPNAKSVQGRPKTRLAPRLCLAGLGVGGFIYGGKHLIEGGG